MFSGLKGLFFSIGAFEVGNVAATLLILRATELFDERWTTASTTTTALVVYVSCNIAATLASFLGGRWLDSRTALAVLRGGFLCFAIAYSLFAGAGSNVPVLASAIVLAGIGIGFVETAEHAAVAHAATPEVRGSAFGLLAGLKASATSLRAASRVCCGPSRPPRGRSPT